VRDRRPGAQRRRNEDGFGQLFAACARALGVARMDVEAVRALRREGDGEREQLAIFHGDRAVGAADDLVERDESGEFVGRERFEFGQAREVGVFGIISHARSFALDIASLFAARAGAPRAGAYLSGVRSFANVRTVGLAAWALAAWCGAPAGASVAAETVCVDSSSPTAALDRRVAGAAFAATGGRAAIVPFDGSHGVSEKYFRALARDECALVMGFPVDAAAPDPPAGLKLTSGYYATGYVLATLGAARSLASLPHDTSIAVGVATAPDFYLVGEFGPVPHYELSVFQNQQQVLDALAARAVTAAMAWDPSVEAYRAAHPRVRLATTALHVPHGAWTFAALYDPRRRIAARRFERGLQLLSTNGRLSRIAHSVFPEATI